MLNDRIWHYDPTTGKRLDRPISVRVFKVYVTFAEVKTDRPVILKDEEGDLVESVATCPRNRKLFDYENGHNKTLERFMMVANERV